MMTDTGLVEFLLDQLHDAEVTARSMFGGQGIFRDGRMFALVYDGGVYVKTSEEEARTSQRPPFHPRAHQTFGSYRAVNADELEDPDVLRSLFETAQRAASRSR
ncbi:MAG: TfoX/Sxy family protein [Actinomycetota bacterium]|nr:TfoX/Sxy family protein [Actinomycetota bacterium]